VFAPKLLAGVPGVDGAAAPPLKPKVFAADPALPIPPKLKLPAPPAGAAPPKLKPPELLVAGAVAPKEEDAVFEGAPPKPKPVVAGCAGAAPPKPKELAGVALLVAAELEAALLELPNALVVEPKLKPPELSALGLAPNMPAEDVLLEFPNRPPVLGVDEAPPNKPPELGAEAPVEEASPPNRPPALGAVVEEAPNMGFSLDGLLNENPDEGAAEGVAAGVLLDAPKENPVAAGLAACAVEDLLSPNDDLEAPPKENEGAALPNAAGLLSSFLSLVAAAPPKEKLGLDDAGASPPNEKEGLLSDPPFVVTAELLPKATGAEVPEPVLTGVAVPEPNENGLGADELPSLLSEEPSDPNGAASFSVELPNMGFLLVCSPSSAALFPPSAEGVEGVPNPPNRGLGAAGSVEVSLVSFLMPNENGGFSVAEGASGALAPNVIVLGLELSVVAAVDPDAVLEVLPKENMGFEAALSSAAGLFVSPLSRGLLPKVRGLGAESDLAPNENVAAAGLFSESGFDPKEKEGASFFSSGFFSSGFFSSGLAPNEKEGAATDASFLAPNEKDVSCGLVFVSFVSLVFSAPSEKLGFSSADLDEPKENEGLLSEGLGALSESPVALPNENEGLGLSPSLEPAKENEGNGLSPSFGPAPIENEGFDLSSSFAPPNENGFGFVSSPSLLAAASFFLSLLPPKSKPALGLTTEVLKMAGATDSGAGRAFVGCSSTDSVAVASSTSLVVAFVAARLRV
jgi:hypothetical protein